VIIYFMTITLVKSLKDRLIYARTLRSLTQGKLAQKAGLSQGTIGNVESGIRHTLRNVVQVARALDVTSEWLSEGIGPMPKALPSTPITPPIVAQNVVPYDANGWMDKPTREAIEILQHLSADQRMAAVANLRTFVGYLSPPNYGQTLSVAGQK
jgi:transcriptional regulator with XRE-family HTH domain